MAFKSLHLHSPSFQKLSPHSYLHLPSTSFVYKPCKIHSPPSVISLHSLLATTNHLRLLVTNERDLSFQVRLCSLTSYFCSHLSLPDTYIHLKANDIKQPSLQFLFQNLHSTYHPLSDILEYFRRMILLHPASFLLHYRFPGPPTIHLS